MRVACAWKSNGNRRAGQLTASAIAPQRHAKPTLKRMKENQLVSLQRMSKVVADTGYVTQIQQYAPVDVTTNPSLVLAAIELPAYEPIIRDALRDEARSGKTDKVHPYAGALDRISVGIGAQLLKHVPGRVSTECDARLAYNTEATIAKARRLVGLYADRGVPVERLYIKIASTWEGVRACEQLQREGISTNMTLLFDFHQAVACADAKAALISPFVGRILDWYKAKEGRDYAPQEDPGVLSVQRIYHFYKKYHIPTIVMAASFRSVGQIQQLAGCDNLTISPKLMEELAQIQEPLSQVLDRRESADVSQDELMPKMTEQLFREKLAENQMASDKLTEGVFKFAADQDKCEARIAAKAEDWGLALI